MARTKESTPAALEFIEYFRAGQGIPERVYDALERAQESRQSATAWSQRAAAASAVTSGRPPPQRYEDLAPIAKHNLKRDDRAAFNRLRDDWIDRGQPVPGSSPPANARYEDLRPVQRATLARENPERFTALRNDWIRRGEPIGASAA